MMFKRLRLGTALCFFGALGVWAWLNEQPTLATQGTWAPGLCVERIPEDVVSTAVHRGWPFSFYSSYCSEGRAVVQYFAYCLFWNAAVLISAFFGSLAAIRYGLKRPRGDDARQAQRTAADERHEASTRARAAKTSG